MQFNSQKRQLALEIEMMKKLFEGGSGNGFKGRLESFIKEMDSGQVEECGRHLPSEALQQVIQAVADMDQKLTSLKIQKQGPLKMSTYADLQSNVASQKKKLKGPSAPLHR